MVAICRNHRQGLGNEFDRLFQNFFNHVPAFSQQTRPALPLNIWETEKSYFVEAEVPGLRFEDLAVLVEGRELTLKGKGSEGEEESARYHRRERGSRAFERKLRLPADLDTDAVEARLANGILTIELPKAAGAQTRRIEIR